MRKRRGRMEQNRVFMFWGVPIYLRISHYPPVQHNKNRSIICLIRPSRGWLIRATSFRTFIEQKDGVAENYMDLFELQSPIIQRGNKIFNLNIITNIVHYGTISDLPHVKRNFLGAHNNFFIILLDEIIKHLSSFSQ